MIDIVRHSTREAESVSDGRCVHCTRKEILLAGGLPALIRCLDARNAIRLRAEAAGAILGLATERKERQAAILEVR